MFPAAITIGGITHRVEPPDYATRLDVAYRYGKQVQRENEGKPGAGSFLHAAVIALHCPSIQVVPAYDGDPDNWHQFCRAAYNAIAAFGPFTQEDLKSAGFSLINVCFECRFPSRGEIQERLDFSPAQAGQTT